MKHSVSTLSSQPAVSRVPILEFGPDLNRICHDSLREFMSYWRVTHLWALSFEEDHPSKFALCCGNARPTNSASDSGSRAASTSAGATSLPTEGTSFISP